MCLLESVWTCNQLFGLVISASCMKCGNQKANIHFGARNCLHTQLHTVHAWLLYSQSCTFKEPDIVSHKCTQLHSWVLLSRSCTQYMPGYCIQAVNSESHTSIRARYSFTQVQAATHLHRSHMPSLQITTCICITCIVVFVFAISPSVFRNPWLQYNPQVCSRLCLFIV